MIDGQITLDEFNRGLSSLPISVANMKLRIDSGFARQFFGTPEEPRLALHFQLPIHLLCTNIQIIYNHMANSTLNINEFRSLLDGLQTRLLRADFEKNDIEGNGMLSADQFIKVLQDKGRGIVPPTVQENIYRYLHERGNSNVIHSFLFSNIIIIMKLTIHCLIHLLIDRFPLKNMLVSQPVLMRCIFVLMCIILI
jgi:hypothetical protein